MSMAMSEELKQISAEMKAIVNRAAQEGRKTNREEQEALDQLTTDKEVLVGDLIFHGYG
ncbi:MAG: hypothetical protein GY807_21565 [Gammaproteobacteria bacterium]|nr:hypothetical protein [Gammaproteobacteria bacterium]